MGRCCMCSTRERSDQAKSKLSWNVPKDLSDNTLGADKAITLRLMFVIAVSVIDARG